MAEARYAMIELALKGMTLARLDRVFGQKFAGLGCILTFHHVRMVSDRIFPQNSLLEVTPSFFEGVLRLLRELNYDIIPMDALKSRLENHNPSRPFCALTFDDGYYDNRDYALPILKRYDAPCTVYVVPGFADRTTPLWWLDLEDAVRASDEINVELPNGRFVHPTRSLDEKKAGFKRLYWNMRGLSEMQVREIVAMMAANAGIDTMDRVARLCMDWSELRDFARDPLVTIGAHTNTHPRLRTLDEAQSRHEILDGKARIERELGQEVRHIAYPVGDPTSAGPREFALSAEAGYETAVTTRPGVLFQEHASHLHALPRISVNGLFQNADYLRTLISGLPLMLKNRGKKLNVE